MVKLFKKNGDTKTINRLKCYSKGTKLHDLSETSVEMVDIVEKAIIEEFNKKFKLIRGREWFEGNKQIMIEIIRNIINRYINYNEDIPILVNENEANQNKEDLPEVEPTKITKKIPLSNKVQIYNCPRCGYETMRKGDFLKHLKKVIICQPKVSDCDIQLLVQELTTKNVNDVHFICRYCTQKFNNKSNMYRHIKICKKSPINDNSDLFSQNDALKLKVEKLTNQLTSTKHLLVTLLQDQKI